MVPERLFQISFMLSLVMLLSGCNDHDNETSPLANQTIHGKTIHVGEGTAYSWATFDEAGNPAAVGVRISEQAVNTLPQQDNSEGHGHMIYYEMELPEEIMQQTPFKHIVMDWNPMGHPPALYELPHFDAHFYMISSAERKAIGDEASDPKLMIEPAPRYLPADYIDVQVNVPQMGKHWVDRYSPELNGEKFTQTMIYGSYDGRVIFFEPMYTVEYLQSKPDDTFDLKQPEEFQQKGLYYPTRYGFRYDAEKKEYVIWLDNMQLK
ncbi:DUF5602 domain-containing protein [Pontibacter sp. FD36]|uniref:DUF5602 domain-containing protein n=1 Tax=Pontibacter sp. FD36 TaxID=2789860 RepID=UPI0018A97072|nr:DUF5602 domain-containing protein [Pontibacter sp. FD36]MBF8964736.1 DUF5602 domain-containing protein [Pontibacter sp. FD36]